ncbi:MAG TPA: hypothetical protein VFH78_04425 [Candidatus Thermoplasmatota archaeon]|nr:hypothetical protein [Candidatus Thermoplasmatota archaeon]
MRKQFALMATLLTALALPLAAAQETTGGDDVNVDAPDDMNVDLNVDDNDGDVAEESSFAGLSTTVVIILIVLAVLVVALIVAMASRP